MRWIRHLISQAGWNRCNLVSCLASWQVHIGAAERLGGHVPGQPGSERLWVFWHRASASTPGSRAAWCAAAGLQKAMCMTEQPVKEV